LRLKGDGKAIVNLSAYLSLADTLKTVTALAVSIGSSANTDADDLLKKLNL
jgi:hypothetical protein